MGELGGRKGCLELIIFLGFDRDIFFFLGTREIAMVLRDKQEESYGVGGLGEIGRKGLFIMWVVTCRDV